MSQKTGQMKTNPNHITHNQQNPVEIENYQQHMECSQMSRYWGCNCQPGTVCSLFRLVL
jgi:hypothetical protein